MSLTEIPVPSDHLPAHLRKSSEVIYHKCTEQLVDKGGRRFLFDIAVTVSEIKEPPAPISPSPEPSIHPNSLPCVQPAGDEWHDLGKGGAGEIPMNTLWLRVGHNSSTPTSAAKADESIAKTEPCASPKQLGPLAAGRPATCRARIGNSLPGQKPVKTFSTHRKSSVSRIPAAIQSLDPATGAPAKPVTAKGTRTRKRRTGTAHATSARAATKASRVLELVTRRVEPH